MQFDGHRAKTAMAIDPNPYESLGATFARQIDEARRASRQSPPLQNADRLLGLTQRLKPRSMSRSIAVRGGEVVILANGGRVAQILHRTADKNGRMRIAGAVCVEGDDLRSNRPAAWAHELVLFAVREMGGAA